MKNIAIFASGSGTNAENIIKYFKNHNSIDVKLVLSNISDAYVLTRAENLQVKTITFARNDMYKSQTIINTLKDNNIDFIVLAGFLWLIPEGITKLYKNKIINIHPALLPKYGGKGMYGDKVHESVLKAKEKFSGITIHYVNEKYDSGDIIFQAKCEVSPKDTIESLAGKVHALEYEHFPRIIESVVI